MNKFKMAEKMGAEKSVVPADEISITKTKPSVSH